MVIRISSLHRVSDFFKGHPYPLSVYRRVFSCQNRNYAFLQRNLEDKMVSKASSKPLNILVYTGEESLEKSIRYQSIANNLQFCVHPDHYLVYMLRPSQVFKDPWQENLKLLVISTDVLDDKTCDIFENYAATGGQIFLSCTGLSKPFSSLSSANTPSCLSSVSYKESKGVNVLHGGITYQMPESFTVLAQDGEGKRSVYKLGQFGGIVVASEVHLAIDSALLNCDKSEFSILNESNANRLSLLKDLLSNEFLLDCSDHDIPSLTPCFLFTKDNLNIEEVIRKLSNLKSSTSMKLLPVNCSQETSIPESTDEQLMIAYNFPETTKVLFDTEVYFSNIKGKTFGRSLFFIGIIGTTMDVIKVLTDHEGVCVVARQQVRGKGRGQNKWISPIGSAAFSTHFSVGLSTPVGQRLPIIQHFIGLSVVLAVRKLPGYENIDIRLKWPNDIYYGNKIKIGGILVTSTIEGNTAHVFTGCGVNVSNSQPTLCVNDAIQYHNSSSGDNLLPLSVEQLIGSSLTEFEKILMDFQTNGPQDFISSYYKYWLHDKQKVTLAATNELVTITGINEYGFLLVETKSGKKLTLQPDGNSFDMIKNLIVVK